MVLVTSVNIDRHSDAGDELARTLDLLAAQRHWEPRVTFALQVAADEWISNVSKYSFDHGPDWSVVVHICQSDTDVWLDVMDQGKSFNPGVSAPSMHVCQAARAKREGGLGIFVMNHLLDTINYRRIENTNVVTLGIKLDQPELISPSPTFA